jgi:ATP-dependent DNA helicase RecG
VAGLSPRQVQRLCQQALHALKQAPDPLPRDILDSRELPTREQALHLIHAPDSLDKVDQAQRRFRFEELFLLEVALLWARRQNRDNVEGHAHMGKGCLVEAFRQQLPFELTAAQKRVWQEIQEDMAAGHPMHRLLQGDVGSGKTVVAVMALLRAVEAGQQAALMAPTELLAEQHYQKLCTQLEPLDQDVGLLTSSVVGQHRADVLERLARGKLALVVGTHALFQEGVRFDRLSLVITDEQHRFGVRQRAELGAKGANPDILVMSATPIPRSLALTFFGDLDTSTIDELPAGRKPIRTYWRPSNRRQLVYRFVRDQLAEGRQAYIVCPLVEESEEVQARAVTRWVESVRDLLSGYEVGVMHGRLSSDKKETTMRAFRDGKLAALVCTTVIEVGIDVPNVSVMVIEDADRFGLAQLHQLRGRIGRGPHQSYCILMADSVTEAARERLALMTEHTDGFKLAEHDLRLRGPGEFLGTRQHGLPPFEHADPVRDYQLLLEARQEAQRLLTVDPNLARSAHSRLRGAVQERYSDFFDLVLSG